HGPTSRLSILDCPPAGGIEAVPIRLDSVPASPSLGPRAERRPWPRPIFTPEGWHCPAQASALGAHRETNLPALKGRQRLGPDRVVAPFQGGMVGRWSRVPRALPWTGQCHPSGVKARQHPNEGTNPSEAIHPTANRANPVRSPVAGASGSEFHARHA